MRVGDATLVQEAKTRTNVPNKNTNVPKNLHETDSAGSNESGEQRPGATRSAKGATRSAKPRSPASPPQGVPQKANTQVQQEVQLPTIFGVSSQKAPIPPQGSPQKDSWPVGECLLPVPWAASLDLLRGFARVLQLFAQGAGLGADSARLPPWRTLPAEAVSPITLLVSSESLFKVVRPTHLSAELEDVDGLRIVRMLREGEVLEVCGLELPTRGDAQLGQGRG